MSTMSEWVWRTFPLTMTTGEYADLNGLRAYLELGEWGAGPAGRVLEIGVGAGLGLAWWRHWGLTVCGVERDLDVIAAARTRLHELGLTPEDVPIIAGDAMGPLDAHQADVICHEGLLEHFDRPERLAMLRHHLAAARWVVVDVPTVEDIPPGGGFGDERLLTAAQWREEWGQFITEDFYRRKTAIGVALRA